MQLKADTDRAKFEQLDETRDETKDRVGKELIEWLLKNGAEFPHLFLREYAPEVRGVHATTYLRKDQEIMRIPLRCLITVEMGKATDIGQKLLAHNVHFVAPKHIFLMMFVLTDMELGNHSFFSPYYHTLPQELTNMPLFWSAKELESLEGSYILQQIQDRKAAILKDYQTICQIDPEFNRFSLERFTWARMLVCSRNFGLLINGVKTAALVPLADMLNHYRPRETSWTYNQSVQSFTITALGTISPGAQVYDSYGKKCNHRFLLNYGFAVQDNAEDGHNPNEVMVHFALSRSDPLYLRKKALLHSNGNYSMDTRMSCRHSDLNAREGFSFARLIVATEEDMDSIETKQCASHQIPPLSLVNEVRALSLLRELMTQQMKRYRTTLAQDREKIKNSTSNLFSNEHQALIFMHGEKQVCQHFIDLADRMIPLLQLPSVTDYRKATDTTGGSSSPLDQGDDDISRYAQEIGLFLFETTCSSSSPS